MPKKTISLKAYFAAVAIFLVIMGVIVNLLRLETNSIVSNLVKQEAIAVNRYFSSALDNLQRKALERAEMIAGNEFLISDFERGDHETLLKSLKSLSEGLDFAIITDTSGVVLARTNSEKHGDSILGYIALSEALSMGGTVSTIEPIETIGLAFYVSAPIVVDGVIIGAICCCLDLTKPELVDDLKFEDRCEVTLFYGTERVNTTFEDEDGSRKIGTTIDEKVVETVIGNKTTYTGRLEIFGKTYETCLSPLIVEDRALGMLSTVIDIDATLEQQGAINYWIVLIACVGIAAALIIAAAMSRFSKKFKMTLGELSSKEATLDSLTRILSGMEVPLYASDLMTDEVIFINDKMRGYFGIGDEAIGQPCWKIIMSDRERRCEDCPKDRLLANPGETIIWNDFSEVAGKHFMHNDSVIDWPDGRKIHLCELYDISDLKQLQVDLLRISSIIHSSPNLISYKNANGECLYINPAASMITGYSHDELLEDYLGLLFDEETASRLRQEIPLALKDNKKVSYELIAKKKTGKDLPLMFTSFIVDYEEQAIGTIATDITEKKRIEAEKMEALARAEHASKAKSDFLSRMSHEMRTPLNAIIGMSSIAKMTGDPSKRDNCLNKVDIAAHHLLSIINDILDRTNFEFGDFELHYSEFSYRKMIDDTLAIIDFGSEEKRQSFVVNLDGSIPQTIVSDERRLGQVIANLLSNAIKFSPDDGKITLNSQVTDSTEKSCTILTEVIDNGIGIPKDAHSLLFEAFEQIDGSLSRKYGGSGLGLAICKQIVELMGGSIWVESDPGQGSKFSFSITVEIGSLR